MIPVYLASMLALTFAFLVLFILFFSLSFHSFVKSWCTQLLSTCYLNRRMVNCGSDGDDDDNSVFDDHQMMMMLYF